MAVFTAASDETNAPDGQGKMFVGGYIAPTIDWIEHFTPAWQDRVLNRAPAIPYLHMVETRSEAWQKKYGLTPWDAECRVAEACHVIRSMGTLTLLSARLSEGHFKEQFKKLRTIRQNTKQPALDKIPPDLMGFWVFVVSALEYGLLERAERIDFIVERKQGVTRLLQDYYARLPEILAELGQHHYIPLLGKFIADGKECVPLQAADVACWHIQRRSRKQFIGADVRRMWQLAARIGATVEWRDEWTTEMAANADGVKQPSPFKPKSKPQRHTG